MRSGKGHLVRTFSEFSFGMNPRAKKGLGFWKTNVGEGVQCLHLGTTQSWWNGKCSHEC